MNNQHQSKKGEFSVRIPLLLYSIQGRIPIPTLSKALRIELGSIKKLFHQNPANTDFLLAHNFNQSFNSRKEMRSLNIQ